MDTGMANRESQISNAFARLDKTIAELEGVIGQHEQTLMSILRDEPQLKGDIDAEKREVKVPLATALDNFSDRVYSVISRVNSMQRRLEL